MTDAGSRSRSDAYSVEQSAPAVPTNTWPMWVIAVLPLVGLALDPLGLGAKPGADDDDDVTVSVAIVPFVAGLVLAVVDRRILLDRGVVRPLHWGYAVVLPAYVIARSVVVHRRVGGSLAPLLVWIVSALVALAVGSLRG